MVNKKVFHLVISLCLIESVHAAMITQTVTDPQTKLEKTQIQIEQFFQNVLKDEKPTPLISSIAQSSRLFRTQLINLAFENSYLTVRDAHWAIEKFQAKEDVQIFECMLEHDQMGELLSEHSWQESSLLVYCLEHHYDEVFLKILRRFPHLEGNSQLCAFQSGIEAAFGRAQEQAINDRSMPFLGYLITGNDSSHEKLIRQALLAEEFTNHDLMWLIKEFEKPEKLPQVVADSVFGLIFNKNLPKKMQGVVTELFSRADLPKESYYLSSAKQYLHGHSHSELHNILVECIESEHFKALGKILEAFPRINLSDIVSVKRKEYVSPGGWFDSSSYEDVEYNLISWLLRGRNDQKHIYLKPPLARPNYLEAAKIIHKIFMANFDKDNSEVDPLIVELIEAVVGQNEQLREIPAET